MDGNAWRSAQGDPNTDNNDWRSQLTPDSRQRIVNKIMETLKKHLSVPEGMGELKKIAVRFEEKIYTAATSQPDYLRRISLKMLTMETKSPPNSLPSNLGSGNQNPPDPVLQNIQPQVRSQGQTLPIPMPNQSQARQQLLPSSLQNTVSSAGMQNSSNLSPALSSMTGITQTTMSNVIGQSSGLQNISGISQNSINNSGGQAAPSNIFANSQRSMQARQQVAPQHQLQQQQNQFIYQQQFQQQILKQKLQQTSLLPQSHLQPQQTLLQATQMQQPSQQSLMQMSQNSGLQSSQTSLQQAQSSAMLPVQQSGLQQNQHSILRQQQQTHQQQTQIAQQQILPSQQQQQQLMGQQTNATNMQQNDQSGQQNSIQDIQQQQQQRLLGQPNNISNMQQNNPSNLHQQQQQLGQQSNISGQQSISGQQLFGQQVGVSNAQRPIQQLLQAKAVVTSQQQQSQQASSMLLPPQGQQSQSQTSQQQQLMSQLQSQPVQLQQQLPLQQQQQPNQLPRDLQQRFQTSGGLLQSQNVIEQQKQMLQPQRGIPEASSTSMDSTSQTGYSTPVDWQEETHQKLKSLKDMYLVEINELYQKLASKCQQQDTLAQSQIQSDQMEKLKYYKNYLERIIQYLQAPKSNISLNTKEKIGVIEKQIVAILNMFKRKPNSSQQHQQQGHQQFPPTGGQAHAMQQQQQQQIQISHMQQQHDNHTNQMQPVNFQGSMTSAMTTMQHGSMPSSAHLGVQTTQGMMNTLQQPGSNLEPKQGSSLSSLQQGQLGSLQQNTLNAPQQTNMSTLSQNNMNPLQSNINPLQQQHMKQHQEQQQLMQTQQMKQQLHPRQIHQLIQQQQQHKQQILQQQQQQQQPHLQQQFQQQQLQTHQMQQLHQINEANEMKVKPGMGVKPGLFQQHHLINQRPSYQQLKPGATFPVSSPQLIQATSPQISQSSPQIDQKSHLVSNLPTAGTPLQPANSNSPFIVPSPSTPLAPSPIPGDSEKQTSGLYSLPTAGIIGHQQASLALAQTQSLAIGTPGISPSPLFEQCTGQDGNQGNASIVFSANKSNATERPLERLIKVVTSMSSKALSSSVSDIGSVVSMTDRIAGSAHVNGSRAAVGEDLVAMTKCRLQARNLMSQDASSATRKMRRQTSAMPLNTVSSAGSVNSGLRQLSSPEISEIESTATSRIKRQKVEAHHMLLEEIKEINLGLIDTVVDISDEDDSTTAAAKGREGTVIKCSFNAVALSPTMKSQYALAQMAPILPLLLLVPANYPICSPILLDEPPAEPSKEFEDLSSKAKSSFSLSVRGLSQPISLGDMARTWDMCARKVITEYARQSGGGNFSSRFGSWESCVSA